MKRMKMLRHTILALAIVVIAGVALNRVEAQLVSGASGLMVVSHDGTLIGNGTVGSPLGVASAAPTATPTASPTPTAVPSATPTPTVFNIIGGSVNANGTVNPVEKAPVSFANGGIANIKEIGTPVPAATSGSTTISITTVSGTSNGDCLVMCVGAVVKPTSTISCPSGFTQGPTGGQLSDATNQPQVALCFRTVTGTESGSYSPTWTGNAAAFGYEVALRGLNSCTVSITTYSGGNTSAAYQLLATPASGTAIWNALNIACMDGATGAQATMIHPASIYVENAVGDGDFGIEVGSASGLIVSSLITGANFALAGALMR